MSIEQFQLIQNEGLELFRKKNTDYGDSFLTYGAIGVMIRIQDKLKRFISITNTNISLIENESLRDTLIDLHNYSAMAIMCMENQYNSSKVISL